MMTRTRNTPLSANSMLVRSSWMPENSVTWPITGRSKARLRKVWVAPGCSKPLPWIGPLTICLGRSNDMK